MKKLLVTMVVATAGQAGGQTTPAPQRKEIKDPAEYNSYVGAIQTTDPRQRIAGLEDFLARYPNSVVKEDALVALMGAYQQSGNGPKTIETASKILQVNPNSLPGLAIQSLVLRGSITGPTDPKLAQMRSGAERGLQAVPTATKPEGVSDADWEKQKVAYATVFHGALGFAALQQQDYPTAQKELRAAVEAQPDNFSDVYPLALGYLQARPMVMDGLWFAARAANLAPAQAQQQIATWAQNKYRKFHGGDDGWAGLLAAAASTPLPPAGFNVVPVPTPKEYADKLIATKSVNQMSPDELELILLSGNQPAADKVWAALKGVPQQFQGKIIAVPSKTQLQVAFSADAIEANHANVDLTMTGPIPASMMPQVGQMIALQGTPESFAVTPGQGNNPPTLVIKMTDGALLTSGKKPPAHRPAPRRKPR
jgi:Flp pilus assembly protein TadD